MDERFLNVDDHGVMKAPFTLWLCSVFLLRHWLLLLFVAVSAGRTPESMAWFDNANAWAILAVESPMLLLVFAWTRRVPEAGRWVRALWRRGREFITVAAALDLAWAVWYLSISTPWNPWPERFIALLAMVDAFIIVVTWRSVLWRQLFQEFPVAPTVKGTAP